MEEIQNTQLEFIILIGIRILDSNTDSNNKNSHENKDIQPFLLEVYLPEGFQ